jgi:prolyl-tRNA editing enzyme YbaK/EbsC (Cys-tRNA(Pro) deacylase)
VAIVKGEDRASTSNVGKILGIERPRTATPKEILEMTGYPCGGTPSFGYNATFLIDERVMEKEVVYTGGGSENSLVKIATKELQKANNGKIAKIRK